MATCGPKRSDGSVVDISATAERLLAFFNPPEDGAPQRAPMEELEHFLYGQPFEDIAALNLGHVFNAAFANLRATAFFRLAFAYYGVSQPAGLVSNLMRDNVTLAWPVPCDPLAAWHAADTFFYYDAHQRGANAWYLLFSLPASDNLSQMMRDLAVLYARHNPHRPRFTSQAYPYFYASLLSSNRWRLTNRNHPYYPRDRLSMVSEVGGAVVFPTEEREHLPPAVHNDGSLLGLAIIRGGEVGMDTLSALVHQFLRSSTPRIPAFMLAGTTSMMASAAVFIQGIFARWINRFRRDYPNERDHAPVHGSAQFLLFCGAFMMHKFQRLVPYDAALYAELGIPDFFAPMIANKLWFDVPFNDVSMPSPGFRIEHQLMIYKMLSWGPHGQASLLDDALCYAANRRRLPAALGFARDESFNPAAFEIFLCDSKPAQLRVVMRTLFQAASPERRRRLLDEMAHLLRTNRVIARPDLHATLNSIYGHLRREFQLTALATKRSLAAAHSDDTEEKEEKEEEERPVKRARLDQ